LDVKRLLIIEDNPETRELIKRTLLDAGYDVATASDAPDALRYLQRNGLPHLIVLDLKLPTMHGFELGERIKRMGDVPIFIMTGEDDEDSVVRGISEYAEDYMLKPFKPRELVARIRRVLSRINDYSYAAEPILKVDEHVSIDFANTSLIVEGTPISLTPIETRLLSVLVQNAGHIVRAEQLFERVWPGEEAYEETLRVHMARLRRKFGTSAYCLQTERGHGYMFKFPDRVS